MFQSNQRTFSSGIVVFPIAYRLGGTLPEQFLSTSIAVLDVTGVAKVKTPHATRRNFAVFHAEHRFQGMSNSAEMCLALDCLYS
ncbi:hypothetical protein CEXT_574721 [Caerostris extrusa]|uniref:Uncharacterized protein n=1 Tax=Caerostris extrusa TaxID=172846 RepID=A0AAV4U4G6_CAEEX|nr:hypothetical protein CEXT_574721 [Caerostris extrusa]